MADNKTDPAALLEKLRALPRRTGGQRGGRWETLSPAEGAAIKAEEALRLAIGRELALHNKPIRDDINKCTWMPGFDGLHPLRVPDGKKTKDLVVLAQMAEEAMAKRNFTFSVEPWRWNHE